MKLKFKGPGKVCKTLPDGLSFDFLNFSGNSQIIVTVSCGNAEPLTMIDNIIFGNLSNIEFTPVADNCPATEVVGTITCTESGPKVSVFLCLPLDSVAVAPPETELILPEVQLLLLGSITILSVDLAQQFASAAVETVLCIVRVGQIPHNLNMANACKYIP